MLDVELRTPRTKPVNAKICAERIDGLAQSARGIMNKCLADNREPSQVERQQFDEICDSLIPSWQNELRLANEASTQTISQTATHSALWLGAINYGDDDHRDIYTWRASR